MTDDLSDWKTHSPIVQTKPPKWKDSEEFFSRPGAVLPSLIAILL